MCVICLPDACDMTGLKITTILSKTVSSSGNMSLKETENESQARKREPTEQAIGRLAIGIKSIFHFLTRWLLMQSKILGNQMM